MTKETDRPGRIQFADEEVHGARIKVVGVGGGGGNAVSRMIASGLQGIEFIAVNTDLQALRANRAPVKIQVGNKLTKGLGAGANPDVGRQAAIEDTEKICDALEGSDMVFITAGLGGGTGTGAAPVVASIASQLGGETGNVLSVAVVTLPFALEGKRRMAQALDGLGQLRECVDSVIAIPNDRLLTSVARNTPVTEAFRVADDVLRQAVQGISDIITVPGQINLDFADVRAVMKGMGQAVMGTGIGEGENRAVEAAQRAISNPLLEDSSIEGARGIIVNITGGSDLSLAEASEATSLITKVDKAFGELITLGAADNLEQVIVDFIGGAQRTHRDDGVLGRHECSLYARAERWLSGARQTQLPPEMLDTDSARHVGMVQPREPRQVGRDFTPSQRVLREIPERLLTAQRFVNSRIILPFMVDSDKEGIVRTKRELAFDLKVAALDGIS
jgi:cell division protein FtsZ